MKTLFAVTLICYMLISFQANAQSSLPNYILNFQFRNSSGELRDTILPRLSFPSPPSHCCHALCEWAGLGGIHSEQAINKVSLPLTP